MERDYKIEKEKYIFTDCLAENGGALLLKELILRGYRLPPLACDGVLILNNQKLKGGIV